tara:strand:- start:2582 stop:3004 length:423 start_codon:yes stop_codon:yes gene_type:complete
MGYAQTYLEKETDTLLKKYCVDNNCSRYKAVRQFTEDALKGIRHKEAQSQEERVKITLEQTDKEISKLVDEKKKELKDLFLEGAHSEVTAKPFEARSGKEKKKNISYPIRAGLKNLKQSKDSIRNGKKSPSKSPTLSIYA